MQQNALIKAVLEGLVLGKLSIADIKKVSTDRLLSDVVPFIGVRHLEKHPALSAAGPDASAICDVVFRAAITKAADSRVSIDGLPQGFDWLHTDPLESIKLSELLASDPADIYDRLRTAVFVIGTKHVLLFTPLELARVQDCDLARADGRDSFLSITTEALERSGLLVRDETTDWGAPPEGQKLAAEARRELLSTKPIPPPSDPASKGGAFRVQQEMSTLMHIPPIPGMPDPSLLFHPGQAPLQKLHSHMVAETAAELKDLKTDILRQSAEHWAVEQYPLGIEDDFGKSRMSKGQYDGHMKTLRELLVVDQLHGDQMPEEARSRLASLRESLEARALTELAYGQGPGAGKAAKMVVGRATSSFLGRYQDEIATILSVSNTTSGGASQRSSRQWQQAKGSFGKTAGRFEADSKKLERQAKRVKAEKQVESTKESKVASESKHSADDHDNSIKRKRDDDYQDCELCQQQHRGGKALCVFNPSSPNYSTNFGKFQRERIQQNQGGKSAGRGVFCRIGAGSSSSAGRGRGQGASRRGPEGNES
jgi:hypothetical protein